MGQVGEDIADFSLDIITVGLKERQNLLDETLPAQDGLDLAAVAGCDV